MTVMKESQITWNYWQRACRVQSPIVLQKFLIQEIDRGWKVIYSRRNYCNIKIIEDIIQQEQLVNGFKGR